MSNLTDQEDPTWAQVAARVKALRTAVRAGNHLLAPPVFRAVWNLFCALPPGMSDGQAQLGLSREYGRREYLAVVDEAGERAALPPGLLADFERRAAGAPVWASWFQAANAPEGPTLLAARWLCHVAGLRHGTAHLVLTLAGEPLALIQLRGSRKAEAPGSFDLPVAGHVDGLQTYSQTLRKEAREELDLDLDSLAGLRELGGYTAHSRSPDGLMVNEEYHRVYRAEISRQIAASLRPDPEEVAGVLALPLDELARLMAAFPERFASGIQGTFRAFPIP